MKKPWIKGKKNLYLEKYVFRSAGVPVKTGKIRLHVISDFHGDFDEEEMELLVSEMKRRKPDLVLIPGDCIIKKKIESVETAKELLKRLCEAFPVFYAPGNHETYLEEKEEGKALMEAYWEFFANLGGTLLKNSSCVIPIRGMRLGISGVELGLRDYKRFQKRNARIQTIELPAVEKKEMDYEILLAHHPKYGEEYMNSGADLTVSGHYHGGLLRLSRHYGVISPGFELFPKFCCGDFQKGESRMVVSAGLGEHSIPFRVLNPRVLVEIDLLPIEKKCNL